MRHSLEFWSTAYYQVDRRNYALTMFMVLSKKTYLFSLKLGARRFTRMKSTCSLFVSSSPDLKLGLMHDVPIMQLGWREPQ